jgi:hypothetical protein
MKTNVNLEMYQNIDSISEKLTTRITQLELLIDEYCERFVTSHEDLEQVTKFNEMLNDLYEDLDSITEVKSVLYN